MDFDLTDDQRLLKESVDRLIADRYGFEQRKAYGAEPDGWSAAVWRQFAELGLLGLPFAESDGGYGCGMPPRRRCARRCCLMWRAGR
jgi:alkylation response protein AidB-like acyl-CoA dehydrogenase